MHSLANKLSKAQVIGLLMTEKYNLDVDSYRQYFLPQTMRSLRKLGLLEIQQYSGLIWLTSEGKRVLRSIREDSGIVPASLRKNPSGRRKRSGRR